MKSHDLGIWLPDIGAIQLSLAKQSSSLLLILVLGLAQIACGGSSGDSRNGELVDADAASVPDNSEEAGTVSEAGSDVDNPPAEDDEQQSSEDEDDNPDPTVVNGQSNYVRAAGVDACSTQDLNNWVDFDMNDYYFFYQDVGDVELGGYTDLDELVEDLRAPQDDFSFATDAAESDDRDDGFFMGYGYWIRYDDIGLLRFREVDVGGPAWDAGVRRGDELVALNGIAEGELSNEAFGDLLDSGYDMPLVFTVASGNQPARDVVISPGRYQKVFAPIATTTQLQNGSLVGYLSLTNFKQPAISQLDEHIDNLLEQGIDELVLDLRYNPGGVSNVTTRLASQLIGSQFEGQLFIRREFNDRYASETIEIPFVNAIPELALNRLVVLTTENSASASEMLPNGLSAWIDVVIVGSATSGKAFGSRRVDLCGERLSILRTVRENARGETVVGGLQPDCAIADSWNTEQHDTADALFGAALQYLQTGACPDTIVASRTANRSGNPAEFERRPVENVRPQDIFND